jgi:hypothetical protein
VKELTRMIGRAVRVASVAALLMAVTACGMRIGYSGPPLYAWGDGYVENVDVYRGRSVPRLCGISSRAPGQPAQVDRRDHRPPFPGPWSSRSPPGLPA